MDQIPSEASDINDMTPGKRVVFFVQTLGGERRAWEVGELGGWGRLWGEHLGLAVLLGRIFEEQTPQLL